MALMEISLPSGFIGDEEELNKLTLQRNNLQKDLRRSEKENDTLERRERYSH